jgi:hypothetical protein
MRRNEPARGNEITFDFSPDECERRLAEVMRRCCGQKSTFNLETGQPYEGERLTQAELKRRGYK